MEYILSYGVFINEGLYFPKSNAITWDILRSIDPRFNIVSINASTTFFTTRFKKLTVLDQIELNLLTNKIYSHPVINKALNQYWANFTRKGTKRTYTIVGKIYKENKDSILTKDEQDRLQNFIEKILNNKD